MCSLILLIALRFVDGVFMGAEHISNNTLALEMEPNERRGFVPSHAKVVFFGTQRRDPAQVFLTMSEFCLIM